MGRPAKLMWQRVDDMRHGRAHPAAHHRIRATFALGDVLSFEHRVASVETDWRHGLGEILTATSAKLPVAGNLGFAETVFATTVKCPYNFGAVTQVLTEVPLKMHTAAFRSVYSYNTRGVEEIMVDRIAKKLGKDPVAFRRSHLKTDRQRAVLDKVADAGNWGRAMPKGWAQGVGFHDEYQSCTACLVEIDGTDSKAPRVTKAVIAVDVGRPINPRGLQAQMLGGLTDAISLVLRAGLHIKDGLPLEGSYSQFHYARQKNAPLDVQVHVMPANGDPGGAGELGLPAAVGAVANAYARATGIAPRSFPINHPVDFDPVPPGEYPQPPLQ
ncbi:MAG: molybdopterin cofactor-binding domain-containing protein, partial [Nocardioidaceae bacterium]